MCVCVCVCVRYAVMQWEWFSYVELMLALKPFLEECSCTCLKDNDLARRCLWPNISYPSLAVGSFLYTSLLTAHVTTVSQNVLWEMLNYSHYRNTREDARDFWWDKVNWLRVSVFFLPICQQRNTKDAFSKAVEGNSGQRIAIYSWGMKKPTEVAKP